MLALARPSVNEVWPLAANQNHRFNRPANDNYITSGLCTRTKCVDDGDRIVGGAVGGLISGTGAGLLAGGAGRLSATAPKYSGLEFSHWKPDLDGGPQSLWNGNAVRPREHALSDPDRYRFFPRSWKKDNPLPSPNTQKWNRIPKVYKGAIGGGSSGGLVAGSGCTCQKQ